MDSGQAPDATISVVWATWGRFSPVGGQRARACCRASTSSNYRAQQATPRMRTVRQIPVNSRIRRKHRYRSAGSDICLFTAKSGRRAPDFCLPARPYDDCRSHGKPRYDARMSKTILLLRDGEEPAVKPNLDLSGDGQKRAERLAKFIPKEFGKPGSIFAAAPSSLSVRGYLTMRPLAAALCCIRVARTGRPLPFQRGPLGARQVRRLTDQHYGAGIRRRFCVTRSPQMAESIGIKTD